MPRWTRVKVRMMGRDGEKGIKKERKKSGREMGENLFFSFLLLKGGMGTR